MVEVTVPLELPLGLLHPVMTVAKPKGISNETIFFVNTLLLFKALDTTAGFNDENAEMSKISPPNRGQGYIRKINN